MNSLLASLLALTVALVSADEEQQGFNFPKLTAANFDEMTEGKSVFLMCYAPWVRGWDAEAPQLTTVCSVWTLQVHETSVRTVGQRMEGT